MEEEEGIGQLGTSLKVPNVQFLSAAANDSGVVPQRYIRPEMEVDDVVHEAAAGDIPVVDMSRLLDPQYSEEESFKLDFACQVWGFFHLINHGVAEEILERMGSDLEGFFKLPLKEKEAIAQLPGGIQGYGQVFVLSEEQKLDWCDRIFLDTQPVSVRKMNFWPTNPPTLRNTLDEYSSQTKDLISILSKMIAKNLGVSPKTVVERFNRQGLRINYYPPCPEANKVLGISPHSDGSFITLLFHVNGVPGLQIKKEGKWHPINPIPGALVVNVGDILEIISNGKYKSIEHRATINPEKERISVAVINIPQNVDIIGPLPELIEISGQEEKYKTMSFGNYAKQILLTKPNGKNALNIMKLNIGDQHLSG